MKPRLLLVGGGHAHLEVVRRLAGNSEVSATLINPGRYATYSGMLPGLIAGQYRFEDAHVDLAALCGRAGVALLNGRALALRPDRAEVETDAGVLPYDVLSLDTGSTPRLDVPGAQAYAVPIKPVPSFLSRWEAFLGAPSGGPRSVVVVGGGAGGVELILAMAARASHGPTPKPSFTLAASELLPGRGARLRRLLRGTLERRGVVVEEQAVSEVASDHVVLESSRRLAADFVVFATPAAAPAWIAGSGLLTDPAGFISVNRYLQSRSHPAVFAAGDVASIADRPVPKAGVYAVRAGPRLHQNLLAALAGRTPTAAYRPQRRALALITDGEGGATLSYGKLALAGAWVGRWNDSIDRKFMAKYDLRPAPPAQP